VNGADFLRSLRCDFGDGCVHLFLWFFVILFVILWFIFKSCRR
jgi:hypothetical protein